MATSKPRLSLHSPSLLTPTFPFLSLSLSSLLKPKPLLPLHLSLSSSSRPRVSTVPLDLPHSLSTTLPHHLTRLKSLNSKLSRSETLSDKLRVLNRDVKVKQFGKEFNGLNEFEVYLMKCVVAAGQEHVFEEREGGGGGRESGRSGGGLRKALYKLAEMVERLDVKSVGGEGFSGGDEVRDLKALLKILAEMERFYDCIGGIIGAGARVWAGLWRRERERERVSGSCGLRTTLYKLVEMVERLNMKSVGGEGVSGGFSGDEVRDLKVLFKTLGEMEQLNNCIGGITGYQTMALELLAKSTTNGGQITNLSHHNNGRITESQSLKIHPPKVLDLSEKTEYASQAALWGLEGLPDLGEIYPLGGSADRLGLVDPETGECLPAAMLPFCGRTLLEGLIRDLQAREFLYFKLHGKQCITPVAIMTSSAKNNHERITSLCETLNWFGRGPSRFRLFEQPLVPAVSAEDGQWLVMRKFMPVCKPGGHGAIWKLAFDKGIFQWFYDHQRKGATIRQVSNVVAATDLTLLALAGIGLRHQKKLGFASCKRNLGATEGINCLVEEKDNDGMWRYGLSCIEYTEFDKFGISEGLLSSNSLQEEFPANTNILYVDLPSAELIGSSNNKTSLPGMVLNIKKPIKFADKFGFQHSFAGGRLECTMQNIADNFSSEYSFPCSEGVEDLLDTFIVYNERRKVTSSAKKKRKQTDISLHQTPDGALLDIQRNAYDVLSKCDIVIPQIEGNDKYVNSGPPFLIFLHPALGPFWEVTRQKFHGGSISEGSELQVEVAEFSWRDVQLDGSMIIVAENIMGTIMNDDNGESILHYGLRCGRCKLQNVEVQNKGIDWDSAGNTYWKHDVDRLESLKIVLHGNAEFEATDVVIKGNHMFEVPDGYKLKIMSGNSGLAVECNPIEDKLMESGSWFWNYKINGSHIKLELVELQKSNKNSEHL